MKNFKKILAMLLCLTALLSLFACNGEQAPENQDDPNAEQQKAYNLKYELSADESYYIVASYGSAIATDIVIPASYNGKPVKEIKEKAFKQDVKIDENTAGGRYLKTIVIPDSVTKIGDLAFDGCTALKSVTFGKGLKTIGKRAFYGCTSLTSAKLPEGVEAIGASAFFGCSSLTSANIPDTVTSVGYQAFHGCPVTYNNVQNQINDVIYIGKWVVRIKAEVEAANLPDNAIGIAGDAVPVSVKEIEIPANVKYISENAFAGDASDSITVYYMGTEADWYNISIGADNNRLLNANIIFVYE